MSIAQAISALQSEAQDAAVRLTRQLDAMEFDPAELDAVGERLDLLDSLKRKYGGSIAAVQESASEFRATLERLGDPETRRTSLESQRAQTLAELERCAGELSDRRNAAAQRLRTLIEDELRDLAMPAARFDVTLDRLPEIETSGAERVEFVFAANRGEPLQPLTRIASGGELSRVLLALVVVLAQARGRTALVFDEIDADIGGATATAVGVRLGRLARDAQVICVTHLAQIASWADAHYVLEKTESRSAATIAAHRLKNDDDRVSELARMLSGESHDVALSHARKLLQNAHPSTGSG